MGGNNVSGNTIIKADNVVFADPNNKFALQKDPVVLELEE